MEEKQTEKNLISLLDYETELAEKTTQRNGLNLQIIVFALGAIIWMFLSTILEQKPNLHKSLPLYLTLIFLWPFVNIFVSTIDGFALSKKPLLLSCRVSHIFLKMSLSQLVASLIFYFSLFVLWLFTPFAASLKNLFIPTTLLFLACYFVIIISQTSFYSKADPLFVPKISSYIEICVLLMLLFFSAITSMLICYLSIKMSLPDVKFSLLAFAITFLLDNMLSIHSQNRAMGSIVDIRRSYADNKINNKAAEKRIRFYITGETYADAIQNEIDRTRTYLESHININANIRRSILASVSSILANKEHFDKATVKEMFENLSYSFEVINFANNDIGTIEKVLLAMKENNESYRYDLRFNLSENPWQVYYVLEKQIPELKKLVASALSERDLAIREYGAFFEKTIPNFNDRFNLLGEMVVKDLKEEFLQNNPIPKNKC